MKGTQFDFYDLVLIPLTPIHIGGGDEIVLGPEDYRLKNNALELIDLRKFILAAPDRDRILRSLSQSIAGNFAKVQARVPADAVIERISISDTARKALEPAFRPAATAKSQRQGKVYGFQRSGGRPIMPGSSVKGCLRTAWLAECVKRNNLAPGSIGRNRSENPKNDLLVSEGFGLESIDDTNRDPFRDVSVIDAIIPAGATRVDKVSSWKFDRNEKAFGLNSSGGFQLMRERLLSVVDGEEAPAVPIRIGLRRDRMRSEREATGKIDAYPLRSPKSISDLLTALEEHHAPLWKRETEKFFSESDTRLSAAIRLFGGFSRTEENSEAALVRIGWASHAESKSVALFRKIQRPQFKGRKEEFATEGSTRHVVELAGGVAPFGWAMLILADAWKAKKIEAWLPAEFSSQERTRRVRGSGPKSKPELAKGSRIRLESGETGILKEDLWEGQAKVNVDIDGDFEVVRRAEIEGLE